MKVFLLSKNFLACSGKYKVVKSKFNLNFSRKILTGTADRNL